MTRRNHMIFYYNFQVQECPRVQQSWWETPILHTEPHYGRLMCLYNHKEFACIELFADSEHTKAPLSRQIEIKLLWIIWQIKKQRERLNDLPLTK